MSRAAAIALALALAAWVGATPAFAHERILFIGNSFTMGANSSALRYRADSVAALTEANIGGVPAIFERFADQAGFEWEASHELSGGKDLAWHLANRREAIDKPWDVVVLQQYSTLDERNPGDPATTLRDAPALARLVSDRNPDVKVYLLSTWTRADQALKPTGYWYGQPLEAMALAVRRALDAADAASDDIDGVIPVGEAWQRTISQGIADGNPYDGRDFGKVDLWSYDQYHASAEGSYLEALVVFAHVTGYDVRQFGAGEKAANELGIEPRIAEALQRVAMEQLAGARVGFD
ncbi:PEP-CTERM sorting domain-containing protein [Tsuneonella sp. YG55]|uniref:PEP-CTERM sorting domain-containing protein n=1 Tax=Tsuneonella litorea TaxID=2976475 RepID=A0A9X3A8X4_9SPHN|nr:DUF4886 domain-containing protein [Tsuneonella litorea]MCT2558270.1 PEP-CTERM sorting domain-containing protein [Tsuneonella litorea]